jgi:tetratricopeptide (TPR) repeat protein
LAIDLCRQLDGVALAIEMAAARLPLLGLEGLHARLGDRLNLLRASDRGAPTRQMTLRATLDWSHELLDVNERAVLRRLAVFVGSFRLDAAQHTAGLAGLNADAVLDALAGLVDKSLVKLEQIEPPRYRLAETTRLYAWERLVDCGETDEAQQGHVRFMSAFMQEAYSTWLITNETEWRQRVEPELGNLRAALHWAFAAGADVAAGIAMAASALPIWLHRDAHFQAEGFRYARQAICLLSPAVPGQIEARLWFASALLRPYDQLIEKAAELERSVILARALGAGEQLCHSLVEQARLLARMGRGCDADSTLDEAESLMNSVAPPRLRGLHFMARAMLRQATGDLIGACRMHSQAAALMLDCGAESLALCTMNNVADAAWAQGDLDGAIDGFSRAVELARKYPLAGADTVGVPLGNWAAVLFEQGKVEQGSALIDEALTLLRKADKAWELCDALSVRLVLQTRNRDAAQVQGFVDAVYAASSEARQPNEQRLRDQVFDRLRESFDDQQLRQLHSAGALLTEDAALRMAL